MLKPITIATKRGTVAIVPPSLAYLRQRLDPAAADALHQLFGTADATAQLARIWPALHLGKGDVHHLTPSEMRRVLGEAAAARRIVLLWLPRVRHPHLDRATVQTLATAPANAAQGMTHPALSRGLPSGPAALRPMATGGGTIQAAAHPQPQPPADVARMSASEKLAHALGKALARLPAKALGDFAQVDPMKLVQHLVLACIVLGLVQEAGPLGAVIDAGLLAYGWVTAGWAGVQAIFKFVAATGEALTARTERDIDDAARQYTDVFEALGAGLIGFLIGRQLGKVIGRRRSKSERGEERTQAKTSEAEPSTVKEEPPPKQSPEPEKSSLTPKREIDPLRLKNQEISKSISDGHAYDKHVLGIDNANGQEFADLGIKSKTQFAEHIERVMNNPTQSGVLARGRQYFYDKITNTLVISNPAAADGGTAFRPVSEAYLKTLR